MKKLVLKSIIISFFTFLVSSTLSAQEATIDAAPIKEAIKEKPACKPGCEKKCCVASTNGEKKACSKDKKSCSKEGKKCSKSDKKVAGTCKKDNCKKACCEKKA